MNEQWCDLVLEGGGVKGIGLVGAIEELDKTGYRFRRVAGTSAGAIVGALVAAGMPINSLLATMKSLDYTKFRDKGLIDRLGIGGKAASLLFEKGIYEGKYLRDWLAAELEKLGVRTFADIRVNEEWCKAVPLKERYKLVVVASDISNSRMVRLPWDYGRYGLDPDKQLVADAVRASMSIPFFYEPVKLGGHIMVDGGILSNFPVQLFDSTPGWPTFGLKLSARPGFDTVHNPVSNTLDFAKAIMATATDAHDHMHIDDPCTATRTIFIDTSVAKPTDFDIKPKVQAELYENGRSAASKFLGTWDFKKWQKMCEIK